MGKDKEMGQFSKSDKVIPEAQGSEDELSGVTWYLKRTLVFGARETGSSDASRSPC